jgi:hypothetical protein
MNFTIYGKLYIFLYVSINSEARIVLCCKETYITHFSSKKIITLLETEFDDLLNMLLLK